MDARAQAAGFFGKVPSHGDFVGRRLPPEVRRCFDDWLQAGLLCSKEDLGPDWLPTWLSSPIWRFVVGAGVCGEQAWAGVMMPSHDRVGRCFPLLLAAGIDGTPSLRDCLTLHDAWFGRLEEKALSALEVGFSPAALDTALLETRPLPARSCAVSGVQIAANCVVIGPAMRMSTALPDVDLDGRTAWWTDGSELVAASVAVCKGFPLPPAFASLLDGRWMARQWTVLDG